MCQVVEVTEIALPRRRRSNIDLERTLSKRNCKDPTTTLIIILVIIILIALT